MKQTFTDYVKEYISDNLGEKVDPASPFRDVSALAYDICGYDLDNGTILMDEEKSLAAVCGWRLDAADFLDAHPASAPNPFSSPGLFMTCMVRDGVEQVLSRIPALGDEAAGTPVGELIPAILEQIGDISEIQF